MSVGYDDAKPSGSWSMPFLDHPTRARIYRHLLALPGDHFRSIVRHLGLGQGTATHHLGVLVKNGLLGVERQNGRIRYYPKGAGSKNDWNALYAKHWEYRDLRLRVLFALRSLGGSKAATVARSLGISRQLASYHLEQLVELGLIRREHGHFLL